MQVEVPSMAVVLVSSRDHFEQVFRQDFSFFNRYRDMKPVLADGKVRRRKS